MFFRILIALLIGLPLGAWSANRMIRAEHGFGVLTMGQWAARPREGSAEADPYSQARLAVEGFVPLGAAEGVAFEARTDAEGRPLRRDCNYTLRGEVPRARAWTLAAYPAHAGQLGAIVPGPGGEPAVATSTAMLRAAEEPFTLAVGPLAAGGNWLPLAAPRAGRSARDIRLVLRLYDTPVSTNAEFLNPAVPTILRGPCLGTGG